MLPIPYLKQISVPWIPSFERIFKTSVVHAAKWNALLTQTADDRPTAEAQLRAGRCLLTGEEIFGIERHHLALRTLVWFVGVGERQV